jgi:hypothetical protein
MNCLFFSILTEAKAMNCRGYKVDKYIDTFNEHKNKLDKAPNNFFIFNILN